MNKKAQVGPIGGIMLFMVFIVMWFVWLGGFLNTIGTLVVTNNALTGFEAFFFNNLNFVVFICMLLGMMGFMYFSTQGY